MPHSELLPFLKEKAADKRDSADLLAFTASLGQWRVSSRAAKGGRGRGSWVPEMSLRCPEQPQPAVAGGKTALCSEPKPATAKPICIRVCVPAAQHLVPQHGDAGQPQPRPSSSTSIQLQIRQQQDMMVLLLSILSSICRKCAPSSFLGMHLGVHF